MKEIKESDITASFCGVVEGFSPSCSSCRAAMFQLGKLEKKFNVEFYKINLSENPNAAEIMQAEKLPAICLFKEGNPVFTGAGIGAIKELENILGKE